MMRLICDLDRNAMLWVRRVQSPRLTSITKLITYSGNGRVWVLAAIILNILQIIGVEVFLQQQLLLRSMLCALAAWICGRFIKKAIKRPRPTDSIPDYTSLIPQPSCESFPSSHAAASVAFATALILLHHPWAGIALVWASFVTLSRFYLGVHFPGDLVGGAILGVICGFGIFPLGQLLQFLAG